MSNSSPDRLPDTLGSQEGTALLKGEVLDKALKAHVLVGDMYYGAVEAWAKQKVDPEASQYTIEAADAAVESFFNEMCNVDIRDAPKLAEAGQRAVDIGLAALRDKKPDVPESPSGPMGAVPTTQAFSYKVPETARPDQPRGLTSDDIQTQAGEKAGEQSYLRVVPETARFERVRPLSSAKNTSGELKESDIEPVDGRLSKVKRFFKKGLKHSKLY